jgi:hypothetical protein
VVDFEGFENLSLDEDMGAGRARPGMRAQDYHATFD